MKRVSLVLMLLNVCLIVSLISTNTSFADSGKKANYEMMYWESVKDSNNIDMYLAYIKKFPNGIFVDLAEIKIKTLLKDTPTAPVSPTEITENKKSSNISSGAKLRDTSEKLEEESIKKMVLKHNFHDYHRNYDGDFKNNFKNNNDGTVTDGSTGLIWEKVGSWRKKKRKGARAYIKDLNQRKFAGKSNWRLPTVEELASLIERDVSQRDGLYIDPIFGEKDGNWLDSCWSSDRLNPNYGVRHAAWVVSYKHRGIKEAYWTNGYVGVSIAYAVQYEHNYVRGVCSANK